MFDLRFYVNFLIYEVVALLLRCLTSFDGNMVSFDLLFLYLSLYNSGIFRVFDVLMDVSSELR